MMASDELATDGRSAVRVLDADPALAAALPADASALARAATVADVELLEPGEWRPVTPAEETSALGYLVLDGVLVRYLSVAGRDCAELLGRGDVLRPWQRLRAGASVASGARWRVIEPTRLAVLDRRVTAIVGRWPELTTAIVGRVLERSRALAVELAIAQLTGVERRLLVLFWHIAGRWGHTDGDRLVVPVRLTHEVLASLVRARRATVTTALGKLAEHRLINRSPDGSWVLCGEPPPELSSLRMAICE